MRDPSHLNEEHVVRDGLRPHQQPRHPSQLKISTPSRGGGTPPLARASEPGGYCPCEKKFGRIGTVYAFRVAVQERVCAFRGTPLGAARPNRLYCDARCRARAHKRRQSPGLYVVDGLDPDRARAGSDDEEIEAKLLDLMLEHARTSWQACRWLMQSRWPQRWGRACVSDRNRRWLSSIGRPADAAEEPVTIWDEIDETYQQRLERNDPRWISA